ncbi:hypothetical protein [Devosia limi]|nr:hypothetical protein [Devosia limi]SHF65766.1 hypothetical protein SAMN02745223_03215 [Devosia limi DSM 17137]
MVSVNTAYSTTSYASLASTFVNNVAQQTAGTSGAAAKTSTDSAATNVTLSDAAKASLELKDFATVVSEVRAKLEAIMLEAGRTNPLEKGELAVDLSTLDQRELYAMSSNGESKFTPDEQKAAGLEMQRRFEAALSGPAAVARVTGNYQNLYKAAAEYFDALGPEEKLDKEWIAGRAALTEGLKQLQADPKKLPTTNKDDPVALYLALAEAGEAASPRPIGSVAEQARKTLDKLYADAVANGKVPTFNSKTTVGTYIDMIAFDSRSLSSIILDGTGKFTETEVNAAQTAMRSKSGAALVAGFQNAAKSSDPTAFSQNVISLYSAMSPEERQAAGWSKKFYEAALSSYTSTAKMMEMFGESSGNTGFSSWFSK